MRLKIRGPGWQTAAMTAALAPEDFDDLHEFIGSGRRLVFPPITDRVSTKRSKSSPTPACRPTPLREAATTLAEQALASHLAEQVPLA
jgi:hypothetical protein